jgi:ADP-ribosyl-[dinitrogen reductase] hydrolase
MKLDNAVGMLVGLAVGDALGAPLEFGPSREPDNYITKYVEGGAFAMDIGEWTDDTAMAMAMADSLIEHKAFIPDAIMNNFVSWYIDGKFIPRGVCFDIGNTTRRALEAYIKNPATPYKGNPDPNQAGNGALMRIAPVVIAASSWSQAIEMASLQTVLTHGSELCVKYGTAFAEELYHGDALQKYSSYKLPTDTPREKVMSGGFVEETYQCAMWAFQTTDNFADCVIKTVNRGFDSDTCGAVAGMIAGAHYGWSGIPSHFTDNLMWHDQIKDTAIKLYNLHR